jgi:hypothetical protein
MHLLSQFRYFIITHYFLLLVSADLSHRQKEAGGREDTHGVNFSILRILLQGAKSRTTVTTSILAFSGAFAKLRKAAIT